MKSRTLVIDARKLGDAGIGTYLTQLVPRVIQRMGDVPCRLWLAAKGRELFQFWPEEVRRHAEVRWIQSRPLSLAEQIEMRRELRSQDVFWATSLAHPLWYRGDMVATVHDVAQLALPEPLNGGRVVRWGAWVYLHSLQRCARELLFVSQFSQQEYRAHIGLPRMPTTVVPLGVDPAWRQAKQLHQRPQIKPYLISVSSIKPHKNFALLVEAFLSVAHLLPDHELVIVGESHHMRTADSGLLNKIAGLEDRVRFLGRISDESLHQWVAHADAMVFPSLYEGFGLPPLEALSAGCPVLSSTAGSLQEVCGDAALYFDPRSVSSLQQALLVHARSTPIERQSRIDAGLIRAAGFDWERTADETVAVLRRVLIDR